MGYIGAEPATSFETVRKDRFTSQTGTTVTLSHTVSSINDIVVWVNSVKQDYTNYSVSGTTLTLGGSLVSADIVEVAYIGRTFQTVAPDTNMVTNAMMADDSIDSAEIVDGSIDLAHMSSESVDEDNLYISNAGTNGQFLSKQSGNSGGLTWADAGGVNTPSFCAYASAAQNINHATATKVTLGGEEIDSDGKFADSRFTPTVAGTYFIIATLGTNDAELDRTECHIYMNGTSVTKSSCGGSGSAQLDNMTVTNSCLITLDTDDYIELYAYAETTDSSTILIANDSGGASRIRTGLMGFKLI